MESPVRIEFFGDMIESVREFDINSQRSVREINSVKIGINLNDPEDEMSQNFNENITSYIPEDTLIIIDEPEISLVQIKDFNIQELTAKFKTVYALSFKSMDSVISDNFNPSDTEVIDFDSSPQPEFHTNLKDFIRILQNLKMVTEYLFCLRMNFSQRE